MLVGDLGDGFPGLTTCTSGSERAAGGQDGNVRSWCDAPLVLQVMTDVEDKNEWKNCIDIAGVQLPTGYFFGASAGTGDLSGERGLCLQEYLLFGARDVMLWMHCMALMVSFP